MGVILVFVGWSMQLLVILIVARVILKIFNKSTNIGDETGSKVSNSGISVKLGNTHKIAIVMEQKCPGCGSVVKKQLIKRDDAWEDEDCGIKYFTGEKLELKCPMCGYTYRAKYKLK